jgi:hypothetical protein
MPAASSGLPVSTYRATCGYAQSGRVRTILLLGSSSFSRLPATILSRATPALLVLRSAPMRVTSNSETWL